MTQNKKYSKCYCKTLTKNDFGKDNDNYYKTCNMCRESSNQRKANNKEQIQQYCKEYLKEKGIKEFSIQNVQECKNIENSFGSNCYRIVCQYLDKDSSINFLQLDYANKQDFLKLNQSELE